MASTSQQYCLRWNNHRSNLLSMFDDLLRNEAFTDVTLTVDGGVSVKCHKVVLAACSTYFQTIFVNLPCKHPIVVLKDVKYSEIKAILDYMYRGEVNVAQEQLAGLLKIAEVLKVKGLVEENGSNGRREEVETSASPPPAITTSSSSSGPVHSSGHASPPHSNVTNSYNVLYGGRRSPPVNCEQQRSGRFIGPMPMWPLSEFSKSHTSSSTSSQHRSMPGPQQVHTPSMSSGQSHADSDNGFVTSPLKRKRSSFPLNRDTPILRTVLGQGQTHGHADSSQGIPTLLHVDDHDSLYRCNSIVVNEVRHCGGGGLLDAVQIEHAHSPSTEYMYDDEEKQSSSPRSYPSDVKQGKGNNEHGSSRDAASTADVTSVVRDAGNASYGSGQKPEWKRYKQYTRDDIMSAIEAVRLGMSALQASRKYGVPSRTLYDKVKKLGIPTSRPFKRGSNGSGACFPYGIGGNSNGSIYGGGGGGATSEPETDVGSVMEGGSVLEPVVYNKAGSVDREPPDRSRAASPIVPSAKQQDDEQEDQVEDLSVNRKTDVRVIVPPPAAAEHKEEKIETTGADDRK